MMRARHGMTLRGRVAAVGCWVVVAALAAGSHAQDNDSRTWQKAYTDGVRQARSGAWAEVERSMRTAIRKGPAATPANRNERVRLYGAIPEPYYPEFYLAVALQNIAGKQTEALQLLQTVRDRSLLPPQAKEYAELGSRITQLEALTAPPAPPPAPPPVPPSGATTTQTPPASTIAIDPNTLPTGLGRGGIEPGVAPPPVNSNPPPPIGPATTPGTETSADVVRAIQGLVGERNFSRAEAMLDGLRKTDRSNRFIGDLSRSIAAGRRELGLQERRAIEAFFAGRYEDSIAGLRPQLDLEDGRTERAFFYAACGEAALALLSGPDPSLHARLPVARQLFQRIRNPAGLAADRRLISPRILALLQG